MLLKVGNRYIEIVCPEVLASEFYKLKKFSGKWIKKQVHIDFLRRCLDIRFVPEGLRINLPNVGFNDHILEKRRLALELKIIKRLIGFYRSQLSTINEERAKLVRKLSEECDNNAWITMRACIIDFGKALKAKETNKKLNKERKWGILQSSDLEEVDLKHRVVNCSQRVFETKELEVLSLGCDFGITQVKNWKRNAMVDVENGLGRLEEGLKTKVRAEITRYLDKDVKPKMNLTASEQTSLREIAKLNDIVVTKADKGGAVVILDKEDYSNKMAALVNSGDFSKIDKKKANKSLKVVAEEIERLVKKGVIEKKDRQLWKVSNPVIPLIKGFPKIHKPGTPLRPVVNCKDSATEKAAKILSKVLRDTSVLSPFSLKNSCEFVERIKAIPHTGKRRIWASLDVVKLFPSVDRDRLWKILEKREAAGKVFLGDYTKLVQICVEESPVEWENELFIQRKGLPIGSSLSPVLSEIYLTEWEEEFITTDIVNLVFWGRYVDDICVCWEGTGESLRKFVQWANSQWEDIQFEVEIEKDCELAFLDVKISIQGDGMVTTSLFQKEVASGILLNERDALPHRMCDNMIKNRYQSVAKISDEFEKDSEILKNQFLCNGHSLGKIEKCLERVNKDREMETLGRKREQEMAVKERTQFVVMDFIGKVNYKIERTLKKVGLKVCYRKGRRLENAVKSREKKMDIQSMKGAVYKIGCSSCEKAYVGETGQPLRLRIDQHKRALKVGDVNNAFFVHFSRTGHTPDWDSVQVLEFERNLMKRKKVEAWYIQGQRDSLFNIYEGVRMDEMWGKDWVDRK